MNKILFIATHPDDETLGCGGTILKHREHGDKIYWLIVTSISTKYGWGKKAVRDWQIIVKRVAAAYQFNETVNLNFPATLVDRIPISRMIDKISEAILMLKPEIVYLPNRSDVHSDHTVTFRAAYSCTKSFRFPFIKKILMYETISETEFVPSLSENSFVPNVFIDISDHFRQKIKILHLYPSEIMPSPYPRSIEAIEALARFRGCRIGKKYAEAFVLLEEIL